MESEDHNPFSFRMGRKTFLSLVAILLFAIAVRIIFFYGVGVSDDLAYTKFASEVEKNGYHLEATHHTTRLGIIYPVSWLYRLFGVNEFSSTLFVSLASIAGIVLIFYFGKLFFSERTGLIAAFLLSIFPSDVMLGTKLLPDLPSAFFMSLGVFLFLVGEHSVKNKTTMMYHFFAGISIGIAYLVRESALLIALFFLAYILFRRKFKASYVVLGLSVLAVILLEIGLFHALTGDLLFRLHGSNEVYLDVIKAGNFYGRPPTSIASLLHYPYIILTSLEINIFYIATFIAFIYFWVARKKEAYPFMIWFAALLIYISVGTSSFSRYIFFAATPRYLLVISIPAMLLLAAFLAEKKTAIRKWVFPSVAIILFLASMVFLATDHESREIADNVKEAMPAILKLDKPIYTDRRSVDVIGYLSGYTDNLELITFNYCNGTVCSPESVRTKDLSAVKDAYVVVNQKLMKVVTSIHPYVRYPEEVQHIPAEWVDVESIGSGDEEIGIYYIPKK